MRTLSDVCIQDPVHSTAYLIPAGELNQFAVQDASIVSGEATVTFVLPTDSLIDELLDGPPQWSETPDVLIRGGEEGGGFHLTFEQLQTFEISRPDVHPEARTYTFPMPEALVAELPAAVQALLQNAFTRSAPDGSITTVPT